MPSKKVGYIEGEIQAEFLVKTLGDTIVGAVLPDSTINKWTKAYETPYDQWVTYKENFKNNTAGTYKHTDGKTYPVYRIGNHTETKAAGSSNVLMDADGYIWETTGTGANTRSGRKIQVRDFVYTNASNVDVTLQVAGQLVVNVDESDLLQKPDGKRCFVVEQVRKNLDNTTSPDAGWNEYQIVTEMPSDWNYLLKKTSQQMIVGYYNYDEVYLTGATTYSFAERYYTADPTNFTESVYVLKSTPDVPAGQSSKDFFVMLRQPKESFNYIDVVYGEGFQGSNPSGDSLSTYNNACDVSTVRPGATPIIVNQKEAEKAYLIQTDPENHPGGFVAPTMSWAKDIDGVTEIKSPPAHFFFSRDSVVSWLPNKKRRPDYWVSYYISLNNDRVSIVLEGDPSPDMDAYYRSFAYIGQITPFSNQDYQGNFGVTVGMGDLDVAMTGFTLPNIQQDKNPAYAGFGRYTSNGMYSTSMLKTRSNVLYQAYYPAFITQLPNYSGTGTLPPGLSKLELERNGFQASIWTDKYHASPIYLVHQVEGYRGYMQGVVAIADHNLINLDELVVDTEELKDPADPSKGNWTEVYKFFSIKTPVNFFKYSANPDECTIAILKEVK